MKITFIRFLVISCIMGVASSGFSVESKEGETRVPSETLRQSTHRVETAYSLSRVRSVETSEMSTLQNFIASGEVVLTPEVSLTARLPFVSLGSELALANPSLGIQAVIFEGLLKGFPSFVSLHVSMKPPLNSDKEFVFKRTDIALGVSSLREVYHLSLTSDLFYTLKLDSESAKAEYGNELSASVGAELNTGYQLSLGTDLNYRRASGFSPNVGKKISGRSLLIVKPHISYHPSADTRLHASFAFPVGRQKLQDTLHIFGDYTIAGIGGSTFLLNYEKKF